MDHSSKLIAALVLAFAGTAHAGYAQAVPPSGWSPGSYAPSANDATYGRVIYAPNGPTTNVGGQSVRMPAAYRLAANAPRIAAGVIFAHPYVRTGAAIASWLGLAGLVWDAVNRQWVQPNTDYPQSDGFQYYSSNAYNVSPLARFSSVTALCNAVLSALTAGIPGRVFTITSCAYGGLMQIKATYNGYDAGTMIYNIGREGSACPAGWYVTPAGCVQTPPPKKVTKEEFEDALAPKPMPDPVPLELPKPSPLPIENPPVINPEPGPNPVPRPRFVPSGDPVPNPQFDPNAPPGPNNPPYVQPGTRVVPSPTPSQPWRVDHQPVNRPQANGMPKPNPDAEPGTDSADKPKPEEQQSLCEKHPDIVACAKLGEPGEATPVPDETKTLTIDPENGFGPSDASCPPPRTVQVAGLTLSMPFDLLCDFATGLKPVIVGLAWLSAAFAFMGIGRRS